MKPVELTTTNAYQVQCRQRYHLYLGLSQHLEKLGLPEESYRALQRAKFWQVSFSLPTSSLEHNLVDALLAKLDSRKDYKALLQLTDHLAQVVLGHCSP